MWQRMSEPSTSSKSDVSSNSSKKSKCAILPWIRKNLFLVVTLISVIFGVALGVGLRDWNLSKDTIKLIGFPGELFMNLLRAMILPLIICSLISSLSQMDSRTSGRIGSRALIVNTFSLFHAVLLGLAITLLIHPGDVHVKQGLLAQEQADSNATDMTLNATSNSVIPFNVAQQPSSGSPKDTFMDLLRNMFTENLVRSMFQQQKRIADGNILWVDGMNVLGMILFSIVVGIVISSLGEKAKPVGDFFIALELVINRIMQLVMWTGPVGIPSMIAEKMLEVADISGTAKSLIMLIFTLLATLGTMCFFTVPLAYFLFTRRNPFKFIAGLAPALLHGLATSSSAATLPVASECLLQLNLDPRIVKFVLPLSIILNTIGSGAYECIAPIFIAQINGIVLNVSQMVTLCLTAFLASMGSATIPSAGLITMILVLSSLGLPLSDLSLIFTIDWFLDRFRTMANITTIGLTCGIINELCKKDLEDYDTMHEEEEHHHMSQISTIKTTSLA